MSTTRHLRTARFELPFDAGGDHAAGFAGLRLAPTGCVGFVEGAAVIRQSIMILLSTRPGERVMRPEYGCPLHRLAFEPNDAATGGLAIHYIRAALTRWEPRIDIVSLAAEPDAAINADTGRLVIRLDYRVRATSEITHIQIDLDLQGLDINAISDA